MGLIIRGNVLQSLRKCRVKVRNGYIFARIVHDQSILDAMHEYFATSQAVQNRTLLSSQDTAGEAIAISVDTVETGTNYYPPGEYYHTIDNNLRLLEGLDRPFIHSTTYMVNRVEYVAQPGDVLVQEYDSITTELGDYWILGDGIYFTASSNARVTDTFSKTYLAADSLVNRVEDDTSIILNVVQTSDVDSNVSVTTADPFISATPLHDRELWGTLQTTSRTTGLVGDHSTASNWITPSLQTWSGNVSTTGGNIALATATVMSTTNDITYSAPYVHELWGNLQPTASLTYIDTDSIGNRVDGPTSLVGNVTVLSAPSIVVPTASSYTFDNSLQSQIRFTDGGSYISNYSGSETNSLSGTLSTWIDLMQPGSQPSISAYVYAYGATKYLTRDIRIDYDKWHDFLDAGHSYDENGDESVTVSISRSSYIRDLSSYILLFHRRRNQTTNWTQIDYRGYSSSYPSHNKTFNLTVYPDSEFQVYLYSRWYWGYSNYATYTITPIGYDT